MEVLGVIPEKPSRRKYRAALKKEKRRRRRQELARLRDSGLSQKEEEDDDAFIEQQLEEEKLLEMERQKLHEEWLLREQKAQEEFRIKKEMEDTARKRQEEQERKLKEEWEEQQRKEREEEEQKLQEKKERQEAVQKMLEQAENELENGTTWQNPEPPTDFIMEKDRANCPFYSKTGACRFGDRCSRKHNFPASSPTLLIKSMFTTFGMEQCRRDDYDPDASLEYSEEETYQQFLDFYADVLPEFRNVGKVIQFKVSCNLEPHLRGNVYVQYQLEEECQAAFSLFNGRWYAGRQLQCEFCPVTRWKMAICGLFEIQQCPRGKHCNFLHVFRNPNNEFWEANRDIYLSPDRTASSFGKNSEKRERPGRHDEYSSRPRRRRSPSTAHCYLRNGELERKRRRNHRTTKSHKHTSQSHRRHRSQSRGRKRDRSQGYGSQSQSSSRSRSHGGRRSGSRDRTIHSPKSKINLFCS
ncbi:U2 small nuclear ribonucleoprotein auxiliary factor 35 kDa subunit-related protein 2 isoform X1 [Manis pentadactyla]|uniref:U2 small nuclear ribonucleoprotein auxiliary factor 35 kDa subunit-related protein 2 isoform X1 n=1 Tax=Manis pentadactyla TaxID=143292 RepID=UPI001876B710|nr:U2 small nuclear ribonucleoprotein auxiliary factor 35 kDa subunit-related protein 2 isoform X1 [Manis pentadactyla]